MSYSPVLLPHIASGTLGMLSGFPSRTSIGPGHGGDECVQQAVSTRARDLSRRRQALPTGEHQELSLVGRQGGQGRLHHQALLVGRLDP